MASRGASFHERGVAGALFAPLKLFFGAVFLSQFPSLAKNVLHGNEQVASLLLVVFSIGIGIGSLLCEVLSRRHVEIGLVPLGAIGMSVFSIDLYFASRSLPASSGRCEPPRRTSSAASIPPATFTRGTTTPASSHGPRPAASCGPRRWCSCLLPSAWRRHGCRSIRGAATRRSGADTSQGARH